MSFTSLKHDNSEYLLWVLFAAYEYLNSSIYLIKNKIVMARAISLPSNDQGSSGVDIKQSWAQARKWFDKKWNGDNSENAPLLNRERGTVEPARRTTFRIVTTVVALVLALILLGVTVAAPPPKLTDPEKIMLELPSNQSVRDYLKTYTSEAHLAGTPNDKKQAEWTRDQFESFGLKAKIDTYWPLLNYPISHRLALISGPEDLRFEAKLTEDPVDEDETSKDPNVVPTFHGYSKNGTVHGRIVYANYGRLEDFQFLKDRGIDLNGTIALMRYGGNFRGLKVRVAEIFGCAGALIYSDPIDDGPLNKDNSTNPAESYPNGPWRSKSSAQRGSVLYLSLATGDPLTPGYAATENATRIKPEDSPALAKIPSLPLSWEDALPILKATQGLGELLKTGWRPRRTIVLASWDAEEYGLVGSTEWVEDNKDWLDKEAAVYINVDTAVSGPHFAAKASPSLNRILYNVASDVHDPRSDKSVFDAWRADQKVANNESPKIEQLGSGSDFVGFLDHVGIASIELSFGGEYGVYHSNYDSFHWMEKFGDPEFLYHQTLVKLWGLLTLRLADSAIIPLYPSDYSSELGKYAKTLTDLAAPHTFPELERAIDKLQKTTRRFERKRQRLEKRLAEYKSIDDIPSVLSKRLDKANNRLIYFERGFIDSEGIEGRSWFKHVVYAPGLWTGYSSQVFPAIADGIDAKDYARARYAEERAARAIHEASKRLKDDY
ncbi:hypothetical protein BD408DRAFT_439616 [Parasitella parasitica]|nr:hypothetical protein BD408DRAFT_439616 [Parasitella parasitica]